MAAGVLAEHQHRHQQRIHPLQDVRRLLRQALQPSAVRRETGPRAAGFRRLLPHAVRGRRRRRRSGQQEGTTQSHPFWLYRLCDRGEAVPSWCVKRQARTVSLPLPFHSVCYFVVGYCKYPPTHYCAHHTMSHGTFTTGFYWEFVSQTQKAWNTNDVNRANSGDITLSG